MSERPTLAEYDLAVHLQHTGHIGNDIDRNAAAISAYRRKLLSDPAVVLEAAERMLREQNAVSTFLSVSGRADICTWRPVDRGSYTFSGGSLPEAFAALQRAREGSHGGGG